MNRRRVVTHQERSPGQEMFEAILAEARRLSLLQLMTLQGAYKGRTGWGDLPDDVQAAFERLAARR